MRKLGPFVLAVLALSVMPNVEPADSDTILPPGYKRTSCATQAQGVEFTKMSRTSPAKANVFVGKVAPSSPVRAKVVSSHNTIPHHDASLERPSQQCRRLSCILGINGDFHNPSTHEPFGGVITDGRMMRSPDASRPQITVTQSGQLLAGGLAWSGNVRASDNSTVSLSSVNKSIGSNDVVLYTRDWGPSTATPSGTVELVLRSFGTPAVIGIPNAVDILSKKGSNSGIPGDGVILAGRGSGADKLNALWNKVAGGQVQARATLRVDSPIAPFESVGGFPHLIHNNVNAFSSNDSFFTGRHPRTLAGWNASQEFFFVVVDGRTSASAGMTMYEAADLMRQLGATNAVAFDGGGGTTFVVDGNVANVPIDDGDQNSERGAPNTLQVVAAAMPAGNVGPNASGYWMVSDDGTVFRFGDAKHHGDATPHLGSNRAVDLEPTPSGNGYWVVDHTGKVFGFGDAVHRGNLAGLAAGEQVTSLSATPNGGGYWIFTNRGRVAPFGNAGFFGDVSHLALNGPVLGSIRTPSGLGYYMVASDGGIFAFGDANFRGSMGGQPLNQPVRGLVPDPDGVGYWLVASDGGIFAFDAPFRGSLGNLPLNRPITGMVSFGNGYLMVGEDGGIFNFSDKAFFGSLGNCPAASRIASVAVLD